MLNDVKPLGKLDVSPNHVPLVDFVILTCGKHISFFIKFYFDICKNKNIY